MDEQDYFLLPMVSVRLVKETPVISGAALKNPESAVEALADMISDFDREVVCIVNLDSKLVPINGTFASIGSLNAALSEPRELIKAAVLSNAAGMIMMHNHPSGSVSPSKDDIRITDRLVKIGSLIGIPLYDHIIVNPKTRTFFSFRAKKIMPESEYSLAKDYRDIDFNTAFVAEEEKQETGHPEREKTEAFRPDKAARETDIKNHSTKRKKEEECL